MNALKQAYFWGEDTEGLVPDGITSPEEIPDEVVFDYYSAIDFVEDDFG